MSSSNLGISHLQNTAKLVSKMIDELESDYLNTLKEDEYNIVLIKSITSMLRGQLELVLSLSKFILEGKGTNSGIAEHLINFSKSLMSKKIDNLLILNKKNISQIKAQNSKNASKTTSKNSSYNEKLFLTLKNFNKKTKEYLNGNSNNSTVNIYKSKENRVDKRNADKKNKEKNMGGACCSSNFQTINNTLPNKPKEQNPTKTPETVKKHPEKSIKKELKITKILIKKNTSDKNNNNKRKFSNNKDKIIDKNISKNTRNKRNSILNFLNTTINIDNSKCINNTFNTYTIYNKQKVTVNRKIYRRNYNSSLKRKKLSLSLNKPLNYYSFYKNYNNPLESNNKTIFSAKKRSKNEPVSESQLNKKKKKIVFYRQFNENNGENEGRSDKDKDKDLDEGGNLNVLENKEKDKGDWNNNNNNNDNNNNNNDYINNNNIDNKINNDNNNNSSNNKNIDNNKNYINSNNNNFIIENSTIKLKNIEINNKHKVIDCIEPPKTNKPSFFSYRNLKAKSTENSVKSLNKSKSFN